MLVTLATYRDNCTFYIFIAELSRELSLFSGANRLFALRGHVTSFL